MKWLLELELMYGSKLEQLFDSEKEAMIQHMYLQSIGLEIINHKIKGVILDGNGRNNSTNQH